MDYLAGVVVGLLIGWLIATCTCRRKLRGHEATIAALETILRRLQAIGAKEM